MCKTMSNDFSVKLNVNLKGDVADKFRRIKAYLGLEQDTEVIRALITWYFNQNQKDLMGPPKTLWHLNLDEIGVMIWDPNIDRTGKAVQIRFSPKGIFCEHCNSDSCKHIQFALTKEDIQQVLQEKRKLGWAV